MIRLVVMMYVKYPLSLRNVENRRMKTLQEFASVHASVHNPFNQERHLTSRQTYNERRSEALAEWRAVMD